MNSSSTEKATAINRLESSNTDNTVRILHTSDWQLGMKRKFLGKDGQARFYEARLAAVEKLFQVAAQEQCDAIVVAGDVFDDNLLDRQVYRRAMDVLAEAPCPVYLLPGNHDPLDAASIYAKDEFRSLAARDRAPVIVLDDSEPREIPGRSDPLAPAFIVGAPLTSKQASEDLVYATAEKLRQVGPPEVECKNWEARINVVVGHGAVEGFGRAFDPSLIDVSAAAEACRDRVMDYVALGDTHSAIQLHPDSTVWYSGAPEVTDYMEPNGGGENNSGKVLIVDIAVNAVRPHEPARLAVHEVEVGQWRFQALDAVVNSHEDVQAFVEQLERMTNKRQTAVKYGLTGALSLSDSALLEDKLETMSDGFAALYPRERRMDLKTLVELDQVGEDSFGSGFVGQVAQQLATRSESDDVANDALKLLFRIHTAQAGQGE
ncbi:metallophosphoesterase family protein [Corynebacterium sp. HMSC28B08]|uniref:metallophosphoesterase family protein n=1 Tax=Corynebacterium TaxID=1716 RepID=UPI0008B195F6|nr:metallophosphoesterase [Corynebacterium sp. HMSC28B08]OFT90744.1 hypothetical protein HMPREF3098_02480 [Corynebacterium sp. HMSC28B08]